MPPVLALTLDLDGPGEYARLHGLAPAADAAHVMYGGPLERFSALCAAAGGSGTVFAIGRDVQGEAAARLRALAAAGHEIACHSFAHDYRLSRRSRAAIEDDLTRAREAIGAAVGSAPTGFRAPGYHLSPALLDALEAAGFAYDSSAMPSPPYYALKSVVLAVYRLLGRPTQALLGSPRLALAPRRPYRPGVSPYVRGSRSLWELPIAVATPLGLPVTGAALLLAPPLVRRALVGALAREAVLVLNLHAMDLVDLATERLAPELVRRQPELRLSWAERRRRLLAVVGELAAGRDVIGCAELARRLYSNDASATTLGSSGGGLGARGAL